MNFSLKIKASSSFSTIEQIFCLKFELGFFRRKVKINYSFVQFRSNRKQKMSDKHWLRVVFTNSYLRSLFDIELTFNKVPVRDPLEISKIQFSRPNYPPISIMTCQNKTILSFRKDDPLTGTKTVSSV